MRYIKLLGVYKVGIHMENNNNVIMFYLCLMQCKNVAIKLYKRNKMSRNILRMYLEFPILYYTLLNEESKDNNECDKTSLHVSNLPQLSFASDDPCFLFSPRTMSPLLLTCSKNINQVDANQRTKVGGARCHRKMNQKHAYALVFGRVKPVGFVAVSHILCIHLPFM